MAVVAPAQPEPISISTALGTREVVDVGGPVLNLQRIESPQVALHQCALRYGPQAIRSIFAKLEQKDMVAAFDELNLSDNHIGDEGADSLLRGLTTKTEAGEPIGKDLRVLLMPRARMGPKGMQAIGELIGVSEKLENVILSSNLCDAEGMHTRFCDGLARSTSIRSLCLAACRLGDEGVSLLCRPLSAHQSLEHLSLQYNRLGAPAATALAGVLASNQTLRFLDLSGNSLGPEGAAKMAEGLRENRGCLQRLGMSQNEIKLAGAKALCQHFMSSDGQSLEYLDLRHNLVPYSGIVQLRQELGRPMDGPEGWMLLFGERQLLLNR